MLWGCHNTICDVTDDTNYDWWGYIYQLLQTISNLWTQWFFESSCLAFLQTAISNIYEFFEAITVLYFFYGRAQAFTLSRKLWSDFVRLSWNLFSDYSIYFVLPYKTYCLFVTRVFHKHGISDFFQFEYYFFLTIRVHWNNVIRYKGRLN